MSGDDFRGDPDYQEAKRIARQGDADARCRLAGRQDLRPELLYYLSNDPDPAVRRVIAGNETTPDKAHLLLVEDEDAEVRADLAGTVGRLTPDLSGSQRERVREMAGRVMLRLAEDQIPRVRQVLAEAIKDVPEAPRDVVLRLAGDSELSVSGPVLERSPVLTDEDLLAIIKSPPVRGALAAIARRSTVVERVADALAATDDRQAVGDLLRNPSAQLREDTLDVLVERAAEVPEWQEPLVERPDLPPGASLRLAEFVADDLLRRLSDRGDLSDSVTTRLQEAVRRRLRRPGPQEAEKERAEPRGMQRRRTVVEEVGPEWERRLEAGVKEASRLYAADRLTPKTLRKAIEEGDEYLAIGCLAVMSHLGPRRAAAVVSSANPKAITALCWKAQLPARLAGEVQLRLGHVVPDDVLRPAGDGNYSLSPDEMEWQLGTFG